MVDIEGSDDKFLEEKLAEILGLTSYKNIAHLITLKKHRKAEEEINKILQDDASDYTALMLLATLRESEGKIGSAIQVLKKTIEANPTEAHPHYMLGNLLADGLNKEEGLRELEKAIELNPDEAEYKSVLGSYLHEAGQKKRGEKLLKEAMEQSPESLTVKHNYYTFLDDKIKSREMEENLVRESPDDAVTLNSLGLKYLDEKKFKESVDVFTRALQVNPMDQVIKENLKIALRCNMLFYRPKYYLERFAKKHGIGVFYMLWFTFVFLFITLYPPLILLVIILAVYTWIADPIVNVFVKRKLNNIRQR